MTEELVEKTPCITTQKLHALREALTKEKRVEFKNGTLARRGENGEGILVERPVGNSRRQRIIYSFGTHQYEAAYRTALCGGPPPGPGKPFWYGRRRKLRRPHPEWEECPF